VSHEGLRQHLWTGRTERWFPVVPHYSASSGNVTPGCWRGASDSGGAVWFSPRSWNSGSGPLDHPVYMCFVDLVWCGSFGLIKSKFKQNIIIKILAIFIREVLLTLPSWPSHCRPSEGCRDTTSAPENRADHCWWSGTQTGRWGWAGPWENTVGDPLQGEGGQEDRNVEKQVTESKVILKKEEEKQTSVLCERLLPWTRKQKSFHMSRRVSFVNPSASYSTTPLQHTLITLMSYFNERWWTPWRPVMVNSHSKVAEKSSDVLPPLVIALDDVLHLGRTKWKY